MKRNNNIDALSEKYWAGETTLEEERILKDFYKTEDAESSPEQALFAFFEQEKSRSYVKKTPVKTHWMGRMTRAILPLAASVVLLLGAIWIFESNQQGSSSEIVIDDPETALQITREAFALLNGKMNQSEQALMDNIQHLDKTLIFKN